MKRILIVVSLVGVIVLAGCDSGLNPGGGDAPVEPGFSLESSDAGATDLLTSVSSRAAAPNGLKVSFRSSDMEFWATGGEYYNLRSQKYERWGAPISGSNVSTEIQFSDTSDNCVFMPNRIKLSEYEMPEFDTALTYDVARLDIGGGNISFTMNGSTMTVSSSTLAGGSLNTNSIVFIDRSVLTEVVYVPRDLSMAILEHNDRSYDFGVHDEFIEDFVYRNGSLSGGGSGAEDNSYMDMDGALFVPFDPIRLNAHANPQRVKIKLSWDLDTIFASYDSGSDTYTLDDSAGGTPYDFDVTVEIK